MKMIALFGAAAMAVAGLTAAAPADAQRHGWNDSYRGDGWRGGDWRDGRRDDRRWRDDRGYGRGYYGHHDGRGWNRGRYARPRVVCRIQRGYYGPVRRCFRVGR